MDEFEDHQEDESEDQAFFGTALDPLDESEPIKKKPIPIEEQIVTDENGRRRFHGAFTGGFSAGYFNTAGSRDGWSPAHFKSSRGQRNQVKEQSAMDFMDEEDLGHFGIAPQVLKTNEQFSKPDLKRTRQENEESLINTDGPIPGEPVLERILAPVSDTIGSTLLRQMGWKPGQGIGPRLSRKQKIKNKNANERMFKKGVGKNDEEKIDADDDLDKYKDFLFAPDELPNFVVKPKDNQFGIGYKGLDKMSSVLGGTSSSSRGHINLFEAPQPSTSSSSRVTMSGKKKRPVRGQAFGVGAYEDEDEDIYAKDDMSKYDFDLDNDPNEEKNEKKKRSRWSEVENLEQIIEGFHLSQNHYKMKKSFPSIEVPKNYQPKAARKSRFEAEKEEILPNNPTMNQRKLALATNHEEKREISAKIADLLSNEGDVKKTARSLSSFQPFSRDGEKQKRYEKYLVCVKNGKRDALHLLQPQSMTEWERERERVEFERAEMLYKPLSGSFQSKFVSAGSSEDLNLNADKKLEEKVEISSAEKAAELKMFGKLTRECIEWRPAKLLCIRFNVKHPFNGDESLIGVVEKGSKTGQKFDLFGGVNFDRSKNDDGNEEENVDRKDEGQSEKLKAVEMDKVEDEKEIVEKPPLDLFKSIFLDSSDNEADEDEESEKVEEEKPPEPKTVEKTDVNLLKSRVQPKGIFANVDFDALNRKKIPAENTKLDQPKVVEIPVEKGTNLTKEEEKRKSAADFFQSNEEDEEEGSFGPIKPPENPSRVIFNPSASRQRHESDNDSDEWTEKRVKKSNKKKSKKKSKKKKSKSKKKKHKKDYSSSSSSEYSD